MGFLDFVWNSRDKYTLGNGYDKIFEKISWFQLNWLQFIQKNCHTKKLAIVLSTSYNSHERQILEKRKKEVAQKAGSF